MIDCTCTDRMGLIFFCNFERMSLMDSPTTHLQNDRTFAVHVGNIAYISLHHGRIRSISVIELRRLFMRLSCNIT